MPLFEGADPINWVAAVDHYFEVHQIQEERKIELASLCMQGKAVHWLKIF